MGFAADGAAPFEQSLPIHASPPTASETGPVQGLAQRMVEHIIRSGPTSGAEALRALRAAFPDSPLTLRVAAMELMRRRAAEDGRAR